MFIDLERKLRGWRDREEEDSRDKEVPLEAGKSKDRKNVFQLTP